MISKVFEIERAIVKLENPYPKDDLITNYKDFLKYRDYLPFYKFNINVLEALIDLSNNLWNTNKRIDRISILRLIKRYGYAQDESISYYRFLKVKKPSNELKISLFMLFKRCFDKDTPLSNRQVLEAQKTCNSMLFQLPLNSQCEQWLCDNAYNSDLILNRVLRYPKKSKIISEWARQNYNNESLCNRRPELVGWLLDEDKNFSVSNLTLIADFEYLNQLDKKAVTDFLDELDVIELMESEFKSTMENREHSPIPKNITNPWLFPEFTVSRPRLTQSKRFHDVYYNNEVQDEECNASYDFEKMNKRFSENLPAYSDKVMLWAVNFSRLNKGQKTALLKKYYSNENYYSFFKIAQRNKLTGLLKWFKMQEELTPNPKREKKEDIDLF